MVLSMEEWRTLMSGVRGLWLIGINSQGSAHFPTHRPKSSNCARVCAQEVGTNAPGKPNNLYFIIIARSSVRNLGFSKGT